MVTCRNHGLYKTDKVDMVCMRYNMIKGYVSYIYMFEFEYTTSKWLVEVIYSN